MVPAPVPAPVPEPVPLPVRPARVLLRQPNSQTLVGKAGRVIHFRQKLLGARIAKQHRVFATFLMVQHKLHGNVRLTGQVGHDGCNAYGLLQDSTTLNVGTYGWCLTRQHVPKRKVQCCPILIFLTAVTVDFGVTDATAHCRVPVLVSPRSYRTNRASQAPFSPGLQSAYPTEICRFCATAKCRCTPPCPCALVPETARHCAPYVQFQPPPPAHDGGRASSQGG